LLPAGEQSIVLTVANAYGEATAAVSLAVTQLAPIRWAPVPDEAPSADLDATFTITAYGAYEWRWDFGDGTSTPWLAPQCAFETSTVTHTFPASGTYQVTATARNCRDGKFTSQPLAISVGDPNVIDLLLFEAQGCEVGFCIFQRGQPINFLVEASATPERYLWDWDGNGTVDEVTAVPVSHAYSEYGIYTPRLTVERGSGSDTLVHGQYILVN
jgi:PKD repeat protein